ncbi:hypothetical protein [Konateibacter massiliensis]|uniref:hypothetical protein n=1 Tax=Konateibacter massiliensis TaxID=2002841 RepID=UPI000C151AE5|nr:hypothetical protein [Konateibacter massiliensis]
MAVEKFKTEKCKVLSYNKETRELDVDFRGYGIRLINITVEIGEFAYIKYRGEIGTANFEYKL